MFYNLKLVYKNLINQKPYSFLNLVGLSLGFCISFIALLYVVEETGYDAHHKNHENIYRLIENNINGEKELSSITNPYIVKTISAKIPEVASSVSYKRANLFINNVFESTNSYYSDPSIVDVFTFELLDGNFEAFKTNLSTIIVSKTVALKQFQKVNIAGETLNINIYGENKVFVVGAVFNDFPKKSSIIPDIILSNESDVNYSQFLNPNQIGFRAYQSYLVLEKSSDLQKVQKKINQIISENFPKNLVNNHLLQPLDQVHLYSEQISGDPQKGAIKKVLLYGSIGFLILFISVVNFLLLYTVISQKRMREIAIRKINGLESVGLIKSFLFESFCISFLSAGMALLLAHQLIPYFNEYTNSTLENNILENLNFLGFAFLGILIIPVLVGLYTVNYFKEHSIINTLQNSTIRKANWFNDGINLIQLSIVCFLIIISMIYYKQINYILTSDKGFKAENIFNIEIIEWKDSKAFEQELLKDPSIIEITSGNYLPQYGYSSGATLYLKDTPSVTVQMEIYRVGFDYIPFYDIKLIKGRNFSKNFTTDVDESVIINQSAAKALNLINPIGIETNNGKIVGVVEDFKFETFHTLTRPMFFKLNSKNRINNLLVKYLNGTKKSSVEVINTHLKKHGVITNPTPKDYQNISSDQKMVTFDPNFEDTIKDRMYGEDITLQKAILVLTFIAIFITILGLIGMTLFKTEQKTKEIGIRKVNGATIKEVMLMLNKDFIKWIIIAFVIAVPIAYFAMKKWLENFAYKTDLSWWIFALAGVFTLVVALLTVSWQTYKAASKNPVESLRDE